MWLHWNSEKSQKSKTESAKGKTKLNFMASFEKEHIEINVLFLLKQRAQKENVVW